jgi:hypothetical protein
MWDVAHVIVKKLKGNKLNILNQRCREWWHANGIRSRTLHILFNVMFRIITSHLTFAMELRKMMTSCGS